MKPNKYIAGLLVSALVAPPVADVAKSAYNDLFHGNNSRIETRVEQQLNPLEKILGGVAYAQENTLEEANNLLIEGNKLVQKGSKSQTSEPYRKAILVLEEAINIYETLSEEERTGNYGAALDRLGRAITQNVLVSYFKEDKLLKDPIGQLEKAKLTLHKALDDYDFYEKTEDKDASDYKSVTHVNLGLVYKYLGELDTARKHYEEAIKLNPNNNIAKDNLKHILDNHDVFIK